jgi:hypothetical protein
VRLARSALQTPGAVVKARLVMNGVTLLFFIKNELATFGSSLKLTNCFSAVWPLFVQLFLKSRQLGAARLVRADTQEWFSHRHRVVSVQVQLYDLASLPDHQKTMTEGPASHSRHRSQLCWWHV